MKILLRKNFFILILLCLSGCGVLNQQFNLLHMLKSDLTPHGYKVKRSGENSFPENGMGVVSLNFTTGYQSSLHSSANTLWRRINTDGTFSDRMDLTYANPFKRGRLESMIEPGTYFLDGIGFSKIVPFGSSYVREGAFLSIFSREQKGWDVIKNEPLWFGFVVKKGQETIVPDVLVAARCISGANSCSGDDFVISMKIENSSKQKISSYKIGYKIER